MFGIIVTYPPLNISAAYPLHYGGNSVICYGLSKKIKNTLALIYAPYNMLSYTDALHYPVAQLLLKGYMGFFNSCYTAAVFRHCLEECMLM